MLSKEDLETTNIISLAVLCQKVADDPKMDAETATKAGKMKWEWAELVARQQAVLNHKEKEKIESDEVALKKRMVDLLLMV